jgi:ATP-dependent Clp protease ATP-binding subunit ClpA
LQVLDDGRLTDSMGRVVDFTNTIIIATSNAHSDIINESLSKGESMDSIAEYLRSRLVDVFKPELLNRFSKIIIFKNLEPKDLPQIVELNLKDLVAAVKGQGITLTFSPEAIVKIAKLGYDPAFGARPLRRIIDEHVRAPLSEALLSQKIVKGAHVTCVPNGDTFDFVSQ